MNVVATATRRFAVLIGNATVDLAAPTAQTLGGALAAAGTDFDNARHVLVLRDGSQVAPTSPVGGLTDGALVIVVDVTRQAEQARGRRPDGRVPALTAWWLLATVSAVLATLALSALATDTAIFDDNVGLLVGGLMALGAAATGGLWVRRGDDGAATAPIAALLLAFAAATVTVPALAGGAQLAVSLGWGAAATLFTALVIAAPPGATRSMAATLAVLLLILAVIWGVALLWNWGVVASAALSLGLVSPVWRVLPQFLLALPDGWSIHYKAFMTSRWTVRGAVPEDPGPVTMPVVRRAVDDAGARLIAGVSLLAGVAVLATPVVLAGLSTAGSLARIGGLVLIGLTVLHLMLAPRHATVPALRWIARSTAALMLAECVIALTRATPESAPVVMAGVLLLAGAVAAASIVPVARGMRSVAWSRTGDVIESVAVALVLPAALLAADAIEIIRRAMAA